MAAPSAQASLTLQDAFERFASTVSPDDQRLFHNTQLQDVRNEAIQIERRLRARRTQRNMARLGPFLQGMEHYSKVVEVLCNGTPFLPWVWAPVKLMLMITSDSISAFEKLIDAYGKIGDMLPRLDRLSHALVDDHNFQNVLALVYSDIIEFHRRAYKFVRRKSWAIFFGSMWANFESRFDGILKNLAYHSELADKEAAAADIVEAVRRSKADDEHWEQQERGWNAVKIQKVLLWLGTDDTLPADLLERHMRDYLPGSCDWFIQHKATELWLGDGAKNPLLWLCGKPGAGKSMICSNLVQHTEANGFHVFYYFCSFLGSHSNGPSRLLRSIISQMIQKHQDLAIYVHDVYFKSNPVPTKKALLGLLAELLRGLGSVRLVVDGIDEWVSQDQKELLRDLSMMISTDQSSYICKLMIASRDTMDVSRSLRRKDKSATTISLSKGDEGFAVTRSIANYVESKLSDLPDHFDELDPNGSIMAHVKKTLLQKSHGMFLWVSLVLELLNTTYSPEELRTVVDNLPSDLEALYQKIVARLWSAPGAQSYGGVSRIMSWICFARRPLHRSELLQALSMFAEDMGSQMRSIPVASILDHCKPLIEELPDSTIVPVHFSVKEYFLKTQMPQIVPEVDAALDISSACAVVIVRGLDLVLSGSNFTDYLARTASGNYRLLPYAIEFWIEHCSQYASGGGSLGLGRPLQHHLARVHGKHEDCLRALGRAQDRSPDESNTSHADERLELFSNMPIYGLMADVLSLRHLVSQLDGDKSSDIENYIMSNDPTLFSILAQAYESAVVHLLTQSDMQGILPATLRAFQESYASTAFRCRFPNCDRLSSGFATAKLRSEHETTHVQRVYCQTVSCQYSRIGFGKRSALNSHTRNHHDQSNVLLIPAKVRRTTDTGVETGVQGRDLQSAIAEPQRANQQERSPDELPLQGGSQDQQNPQDQITKLREDPLHKIRDLLDRKGRELGRQPPDRSHKSSEPALLRSPAHQPVYIPERQQEQLRQQQRLQQMRNDAYAKYHPPIPPYIPAGDDSSALENFDWDEFWPAGNQDFNKDGILDRDFEYFNSSDIVSRLQLPAEEASLGELPQWSASTPMPPPSTNGDAAPVDIRPTMGQKAAVNSFPDESKRKWAEKFAVLKKHNNERLRLARMRQDREGMQQTQQTQPWKQPQNQDGYDDSHVSVLPNTWADVQRLQNPNVQPDQLNLTNGDDDPGSSHPPLLLPDSSRYINDTAPAQLYNVSLSAVSRYRPPGLSSPASVDVDPLPNLDDGWFSPEANHVSDYAHDFGMQSTEPEPWQQNPLPIPDLRQP